MVRTLCVCHFILSALISPAQTKRWIGAGDGFSWSDAANWSPAGVPAFTDDVLLDNSVITISYTVKLPDGNNTVSINSLTITPLPSDNIILKLPLANTSTTAFTASGPGDAVVLNKGAIFINSSGAASGTPVTVTGTNFFRINNGGKYIHNTARGHTNNLVARLSTAAGTENGTFEFDVPDASYFVSLTGRTYGNLVLSSTSHGGNVTYSGNGVNAMNVNGDFQINSGVTFSMGLTGDFIVRGNYSQAAASIFNLQNSVGNNLIKLKGNVSDEGIITATGTGFPVMELDGSVNQNVSVTGSLTNSISFRMNNAAGATLHSPLILPYNLDLQNGKIKTDLINILSLSDNATVTGGSSVSFVEGPMRKTGDDERFSFPVGKGSVYAPISFYSPGMSITDAFEAEYFRLNPQTIYGTNYEPSLIQHISYTEYWRLEKTSGSTTIPASVGLTITQYSFAKDINSLYVARYNPGDFQWKNSDVSLRVPDVPVPPFITGSITSVQLTQSGIFTLATNESDAINPLPVDLISFKADKTSDGKLRLTWELTADDYTDVEFGVERSVNGNEFIPFKKVNGNSTDRFYTLYDDQQNAQKTRYRLKITSPGDGSVYSNIVSVSNNLKGWFINLFPNPVTTNGVININSSAPVLLNFIIYDVVGNETQRWSGRVTTGMNYIPLQTGNIKCGVYFLSVTDGETRRISRFIKQ